MTHTISVALCTFNGERFIAEQVESILAQTILPDELVVSDDGSTDETVLVLEKVLRSFSLSHPNSHPAVRILRNAVPLGVVHNFEQAIMATAGNIIVLCDQDDRWQPNRIELGLQAFDAHPELTLLHGNARLVDSAGIPLGHTLFDTLAITDRERALIRSGDGLAALLGRNIVTGATTMFRRELLEAALPFPPSWIHDEWLAVMAASIGRLEFLEDELIDYRQHGGNAIGAERLGLRAKLRRLREPREERNQRLVSRAAALVDRLAELGSVVSPTRQALARGKLAHERMRLALPPSNLKRLVPVMREFHSGGYSGFGRGAQDALRDLVQPAS